MALYVTRHGETPWNTANRVCGLADIPLTDQGVLQAMVLAEEVKDLPITRIISSPLIRAKTTAQIVADKNHLPLTIDERLKEFDFGRYDGVQCDAPDFLAQRQNLAISFPEGESILKVAERIYPLLKQLENEQNETVLLVCHNGLIRVINSYFKPMTNENFFEFNTGNCEIRMYSL